MSQIQVTLLNHTGTDRQVAESAWTSCYTKDSKAKKTDEQVAALVKLLAEEGHHVPFEHTLITFHIKLPIYIDRQLVKHRIGTSHSGMSGRYRTMPNEFLDSPSDVKNIIKKSDYPEHLHLYEKQCHDANFYYNQLVQGLKASENNGSITNAELKRAREFIRGMLPQHNMVETVTTFNLRSLAHFVKLRDKPNAQPEIQFIAKEMVRLLKEIDFCPVSMEYLFKESK